MCEFSLLLFKGLVRSMAIRVQDFSGPPPFEIGSILNTSKKKIIFSE